MLKRAAASLGILGAVVFISFQISAATDDQRNKADLVVHEWGTFTSIAGEDGRAVEWLPYGGPTGRSDLPCFVERFEEFPEWLLSATVRMETPVLYFYSPRPTSVDVRVRFPEGIMTEWYPHASIKEIVKGKDESRAYFDGISGLEWRNVKVRPGTTPVLPTEPGPSHYYAARETGATPIRVKEQDERFLFYRGVGTFSVPIAAKVQQNGQITVRRLGKNPIPAVVLFENRGGTMGYRASGVLKKEITLDPPERRKDLASLKRHLESVLIQNGLYPREAQAMLATWQDLWFEEGTRVFYIVPQRAVDQILPLHMNPKPAQTARVFVGRIEIITPEIEKTVAAAIRANDSTVLQTYARFLGPVTKRLLARSTTAEDTARLEEFQTRSVDSATYLNSGLQCVEEEN
jgi:hypothetical protein